MVDREACRWVVIAIALAVLAGCTRTHYRQHADADAYSALDEKSAFAPWELPRDFNVVPQPGSRFFDPTPTDDPLLPLPAPQLYAYDLPALPPRDPRRFRPHDRGDGLDAGMQYGQHQPLLPGVHPAAFEQGPEGVRSPRTTFVRLPWTAAPPLPKLLVDRALRRASFDEPRSARDTADRGDLPAPDDGSPARDSADAAVLEVLPIPAADWETVPDSCRARMLAFASLRGEFARTYGRVPRLDELNRADNLALEDILELALLNSREFQTQKEILYQAALRLSLQRFDYDLKVSTGGNRIANEYTHRREAGTVVNRLSLPTELQADKMLLTGGDLILRFANSVVFTFNGPDGFAADLGSDFVIDIAQTVFQRDVRFETLTQAERDVIYAARDFARFRKTLFTQLANDYYALIRTYRQVEIDSQNYFTLVRAFHQEREEYRAGFVPRFQLDQVEQNVLTGLSRLISTCNGLERSLDSLKIRIGLPTETRIDIDLTELEQLTRRDELAVNRELVRRVTRRLAEERSYEAPNRAVLITQGIVLIERVLDGFETLEQLGEQPPEDASLRDQRARLQVQAAQIDVQEARRDLELELRDQPLSLPKVFFRTTGLVESLMELINRQIELAELLGDQLQAVDAFRGQVQRIQEEAAIVTGEFNQLIADERPEQQNVVIERMTALKDACERLVGTLNERTQTPPPGAADVELQETIRQMDQLVADAEHLLGAIGSELVPVEIDVDDAMLTALVLRFDLMNERGALADDWRQIKLAADDLKSVLNLRATETLARRTNGDQVAETRVSATLDLPFNRRAQRNTFRTTLLDYQSALRRLMALEDDIKFDVRNDLRQLALDKEQYRINVASAALAFERVVSTLAERQFGSVTARDFLEAQNAYASALSNVAQGHISYITDRMTLFLDLELLTVDESGFWRELHDESFQPEPYYQLPPQAFPVYGQLPPGLRYSAAVRRMEQVPPGTSMIHESEPASPPAAAEELAPPTLPGIQVP